MQRYSILFALLEHACTNTDTHEITQYTNTLHLLRSLAQNNSDHELLEFSYLLEIRHALQNNLSNVNVEQLLSLASEAATQNPLRQSHSQLGLMKMLLHILYLMDLGNGTVASAKLREHHQYMDSYVAKDIDNWRGDGKFEVSVCGGQHKLYFQWFTQAESFVFGYLLSGVVNLPDHSSMKAWTFLNEGIRVVDSTFQPTTLT